MNLSLETNDSLLNRSMRRSFFLYKKSLNLLLWVTTLSAASFEMHGQIKTQTAYQLFQENNQKIDVDDQERVSPIDLLQNVFLDFDWKYSEKANAFVRLGYDAYQTQDFYRDCLFPQTTQNAVKILAAYANYDVTKETQIQSGFIPLGTLQSTRDDPYSLTIDPTWSNILSIRDQKIGLRCATLSYPIAFQAAVWNQTYFQPISGFSEQTYDNLASFSELNTDWIDTIILETDYRARLFKLGYGAAVTFAPETRASINTALSASFLSMPFSRPLVVATLGALDSDTAVGLSLYNYFSSYQLHYIGLWKSLVLELNLEYNHSTPQAKAFVGQQANTPSMILQQNPLSVAYSALLSYTFWPKSCYEIDPLSGRFAAKPIGWTLGCGYSSEIKQDAFALLSTVGQNDWLSSVYATISGADRLTDAIRSSAYSDHSYRLISLDNTIPDGSDEPYITLGSFNPQGDPDHAITIKSQTLTFLCHYQFNEHMEWKNELSYTDHRKVLFGQDFYNASNAQAAYVPSINWYKTATFRTQLAIVF